MTAINHRTQDRVHWAYECDHMRHVVRHEDGWRHVDLGVLGSTCTAGIYRVDVRYSGDHSASQAVGLVDSSRSKP